MKDVAPRIFRGLEARDGRPGFDLIVAAAVAAFGSLRSPSRTQSAEFARLVVPLWHQVRPETRRALAASLSHTARVPAEIVDLVVDAPLEVSAPFLVSSPSLTPAHLQRLAARRDPRLDRLVKGRGERGLDRDSAGDRVIVSAPPLAADHAGNEAPSPGDAAEFVRDTLRRMARAESPQEERIGLALLRSARSGDPAGFFETLAERLSLSPAERHAAEVDDAGDTLALLLKGLGIGTGEALAILMLVHPAIGLDVRAFEAMAARYRALVVEPRPERPSLTPDVAIERPLASPQALPVREAAAPLRRRSRG